MTATTPTLASATNPGARPARFVWGLVAGASLLACAASALEMARRIRAFHETSPREVFRFQHVLERGFNYAGRSVSVADDMTNPAAAEVVLRFGDQERRIPVTIPPDEGGQALLRTFPESLMPHQDWLRVMRMASGSGKTPQEFLASLQQGDADRLIVVTRIPRPGSDPRTWGSVWKKDWTFDFYELTPAGEIVQHPRLAYPTTRGIKEPRPGELHENTWQFQAALQLMPQAGGVGPTHNFFGNAIASAGWTLPVSAFAGLLGTVALVFAFAPATRGGRSYRAGA